MQAQALELRRTLPVPVDNNGYATDSSGCVPRGRKIMTYREPTHGLGKIMLARHQEGTCGWGCPFCKQEEEERPVRDAWNLQARLDSDYARLDVQTEEPEEQASNKERK